MPKTAPKKKSQKWKKDRRQVKTSRNVRLGIVVLVLLVVLIGLSKFLSTVNSLNEPYSKGSSYSNKVTSWDGKGRANIIIYSSDVYLLSFDPSDKTLLFLKIPSQLYVDLPYGFGSWPVGSVYKLGQSEKTPIGIALLEGTISSTLGIPIDGSVVTSQKITEKSLEGLSGLNILRQSQTNLSFLEYLNLWWQVRGVRFDKVDVIDGGESTLTSSMLLPDGSRALSLDKVKADQLIQRKLIDSKLKDEGVSVAIFNATAHPGLAEKGARIVSNMGGRVISTANLETQLEVSQVVGKNSYTKDRLSQIFAPNCLEAGGLMKIFQRSPKCTANNRELTTSGADVNLILGEDYFMRYNRLDRI